MKLWSVHVEQRPFGGDRILWIRVKDDKTGETYLVRNIELVPHAEGDPLPEPALTERFHDMNGDVSGFIKAFADFLRENSIKEFARQYPLVPESDIAGE